MKKKKNQIAITRHEIKEKPFTTEYTEFLKDRIKMNMQIHQDYNMNVKFRNCIYPFIAGVYRRIASEFYLDKNPAMKRLIYNFSDDVQTYMFRSFMYYFDLSLIYNSIDMELQRYEYEVIETIDSETLLKYIHKYTVNLIDMYAYDCVLYMTNALSESLYCILICELNSSDFDLVGNVIADIINDFIPVLKKTVADVINDYFRFREVLFD